MRFIVRVVRKEFENEYCEGCAFLPPWDPDNDMVYDWVASRFPDFCIEACVQEDEESLDYILVEVE